MTSLLLDVRHGSRAPRVSSYPRSRTSAGQEAVDLAESAGLFLDPWQQDVLRASLGERPDGFWATPDVGLVVPRQNGKGAVLEARELAGLFLFGEQILHTSHEFKTSMDHFRRLERLIRDTPDLLRKVAAFPKAPGTEGIVLRDGRALRFMARTKGAGRGFPADVVILDEAFALNDDHLSALAPTIQSKPNPQTWYTSSPPLDGLSGEPLFALRARGESGTDPDLAWFDWGAEMGVDPDDVEVWYQTNPAMGYRLSERGMRGMRLKLSAEAFARECLGVWPKSSAETWSILPRSAWRDAEDPDSAPQDPVAFALEVDPTREWASIAAAGRRRDGLRHVELIEHRPGTAWAVEWLTERVARWRPCALVVDAGGPAGSLIPDLEAAGLEVIQPSVRDFASACGAFFDGIAGQEDPSEPERVVRDVRHRGQPELTAAAAGAVWRKVGDARVFERFPPEGAAGLVPAPLVAAALALWGHATRAHLYIEIDGDLMAGED